MKRCPQCRILVTKDCWLCKCGYEFDGKEASLELTKEENTLAQARAENCAKDTKGLVTAILMGLIAWSICGVAFVKALMSTGGGGHGALGDGLAVLFIWCAGGLFALVGSIICLFKNTGFHTTDCRLPKLLNYSYFAFPMALTVIAALIF